jgi:small subunit ribosomal protein S2
MMMSKSIDKILSLVTAAIVEGLSDRVLTKKVMLLLKLLLSAAEAVELLCCRSCCSTATEE